MLILPQLNALLSTAVLLLCVTAAVFATAQPSVTLQNAAAANSQMPVLGLGTGAYGSYYKNDSAVTNAVSAWLAMGGKRIDASFTYHDQIPVGEGIRRSGELRENVFITSKIGPSDPLGYNETLFQFGQVLSSLKTSYVDLLLIHWPGQIGSSGGGGGGKNPNSSKDPNCAGPTADPRRCRQSTWRAMEQIFANGTGAARAIGVSNFEVRHLKDIEDMGGHMPAVNQVEFHPFWHEDALVQYCRDRQITFNGYSPLGAPDVSSKVHGWDLRSHPTVISIANRINKTPAQVILRYEYQQHIVLNPRTKNTAHMRDNLAIFDFELDPVNVARLEALKAPDGDQSKICPDPNSIP